jgi:hypothetical protein
MSGFVDTSSPRDASDQPAESAILKRSTRRPSPEGNGFRECAEAATAMNASEIVTSVPGSAAADLRDETSDVGT